MKRSLIRNSVLGCPFWVIQHWLSDRWVVVPVLTVFGVPLTTVFYSVVSSPFETEERAEKFATIMNEGGWKFRPPLTKPERHGRA